MSALYRLLNKFLLLQANRRTLELEITLRSLDAQLLQLKGVLGNG